MEENSIKYNVVINKEEQYSIWAALREIPAGWKIVGAEGTRQECLDRIKELWTDMRPLSLRNWINENKDKLDEERKKFLEISEENLNEVMVQSVSPIVQLLTKGTHNINIDPCNNAAELLESIQRKYVHINFSDTKGETCLGMKLDSQLSSWKEEQFKEKKGCIYLVGTLTLDGTNVCCKADIDLATLKGKGSLEVIQNSDLLTSQF